MNYFESVETSHGSSSLDYATCPLSRCYLQSYLVKNTAGAGREPC